MELAGRPHSFLCLFIFPLILPHVCCSPQPSPPQGTEQRHKLPSGGPLAPPHHGPPPRGKGGAVPQAAPGWPPAPHDVLGSANQSPAGHGVPCSGRATGHLALTWAWPLFCSLLRCALLTPKTPREALKSSAEEIFCGGGGGKHGRWVSAVIAKRSRVLPGVKGSVPGCPLPAPEAEGQSQEALGGSRWSMPGCLWGIFFPPQGLLPDLDSRGMVWGGGLAL